MITAEDIREKTFTKSLNGYNMGQVDDFLEEIAADISAMAKENAALTAKMRVLVEKIEEYRQTEDSMRLALLSAQKMGAQVEAEAQQKADAIVAQARDTAARLTRHATEGIASEEQKLEEAKKATARFIEHMEYVCKKQLEFYEKLDRVQFSREEEPEAEQPAPAPAPEPESARPSREAEVDEAVKSIESSVERAAMEEPAEPVVVDTDIPEEEEEPTRRYGEEPPKKKFGFDDYFDGSF